MARLPLFLLLSGCSAAFAGLELLPMQPPASTTTQGAPQLFAELPGHGETLRDAAHAATSGDRLALTRALGPLRDQFTHGAVPADQRAYVYGIIDRVPMALHGRTQDDVQRGVGLALAWCGDCHEASAAAPPRPTPPGARASHAGLLDVAVDAALWPAGAAWDELGARVSARDAATAAVFEAVRDLPTDRRSRGSTAVRAETFRRVSAACVACHQHDGVATDG